MDKSVSNVLIDRLGDLCDDLHEDARNADLEWASAFREAADFVSDLRKELEDKI